MRSFRGECTSTTTASLTVIISEFRQELFGRETAVRFLTKKLLDFAANEAELEASPNPFSKVALAHLKAMQTQADPAARHAWKVRLRPLRAGLERGRHP